MTSISSDQIFRSGRKPAAWLRLRGLLWAEKRVLEAFLPRQLPFVDGMAAEKYCCYSRLSPSRLQLPIIRIVSRGHGSRLSLGPGSPTIAVLRTPVTQSCPIDRTTAAGADGGLNCAVQQQAGGLGCSFSSSMDLWL